MSHRSHFLEGFIVNPYSYVPFHNITSGFFFQKNVKILFEDFVKTKHLWVCWVSS